MPRLVLGLCYIQVDGIEMGDVCPVQNIDLPRVPPTAFLLTIFLLEDFGAAAVCKLSTSQHHRHA
jgi:hypothetical protein